MPTGNICLCNIFVVVACFYFFLTLFYAENCGCFLLVIHYIFIRIQNHFPKSHDMHISEIPVVYNLRKSMCGIIWENPLSLNPNPPGSNVLDMYSVLWPTHFTVHTEQLTLRCSHCTVHITHCTEHNVLYTVHSSGWKRQVTLKHLSFNICVSINSRILENLVSTLPASSYNIHWVLWSRTKI